MAKKKVNFRKFELKSETNIILGRNDENNDELMKEFKGKNNTILHTSSPGSPFCVILKEKPSKTDIKDSAIICSKYSQSWRNNKKDISIDVFTGKDISKPLFSKRGTWKVKKSRKIKVRKKEIIKFEKTLKK